MPYLQQSETDRAAMLAAVGVDSVEDLFAQIPKAIRLGRELEIEGEWTER